MSVRAAIERILGIDTRTMYKDGNLNTELPQRAKLSDVLNPIVGVSPDGYLVPMMYTKSVPDADATAPDGGWRALTHSHNRALNVKDMRWYDWVPEGRTVFEDRFNNTISWVQAAGTVAYSTVRPYPGNVNTMRMTTGAGAGNQAQATLRHFRLADALSRPNGPKIWYGVLFKNTDANLGFIELGIQLTDGAQTMIARARLAFPSGLISVLDSAGATTPLTDPSQNTKWSSGGTAVALSTSEGWHWFGMELLYQSGGLTLQYVRIRIDDTAYDSTPYVSGFNSGIAGVSDSLMEITVQNNAAIVEICDIGYVSLKDLMNLRGILG